LLLLVLVACSSTSTDGVSGYSSVDDMRDVVESAGFACTAWRPLTEVEPTDAVEIAKCTSDAIFLIHTDAAQVRMSVDSRAETINSLTGGTSVALLGPNWAVNCGEEVDTCAELQRALGGDLEVASP
jgi:hypothetical protein